MTVENVLGVEPVFLAYLAVFGVAAVACFASAGRARLIDDPGTRHGLVGLLLTSGGWSTAHFAFLLAPTPGLKTVSYLAGLVVGFAAVGAWLYFCSAYTGRSLHRDRALRRVAVVVFVAVVFVKVTNPLHGLYFTTELTSAPFSHLAVDNGLFHWLVMGFSYALAAVGYFMLFELFVQVSYDTRPLVLLVSVTGLPIVLDVIGLVSPVLLDITYEPLGVAVFAVGILYVYVDRFQAIRMAGERDDPVIVLNADDRIRDYNRSAADLFPGLRTQDVIGTPVWTALPEIADASVSETSIIEFDRDRSPRYYRLTENRFGTDRAQLGRLLVLTDVTDRERYRRELERQNERLERFADVVAHDLRNPLNVATARLDFARDGHESEHLEAVAHALSRMESLIEDLLTLARQGRPIDETERVSLAALASRSGRLVDMGTAELVVESDLAFVADGDRVQQLLENLFRNSVEHGSTSPREPASEGSVERSSTRSRPSADDSVEHGGADVTIRVGALENATGFYIEDDGVGIPPEERDRVLESGVSTAEDGTGFGLAIVEEIVDAHGWELRITESPDGGARFEILNVDAEVRPASE